MVAQLPTIVRHYAILQVAVSNGSPTSWSVKPEDFHLEPKAGSTMPAEAAATVVGDVLQRAGRNDVTKLISAYETGLYNNAKMHSTNGYEARRQSAMAELGSNRIKAAAAASAIALVATRLKPGESTDGAIFYPNQGKPLGAGRLKVTAAGEIFEFQLEPTGAASKTRQ